MLILDTAIKINLPCSGNRDMMSKTKTMWTLHVQKMLSNKFAYVITDIVRTHTV